MRLLLWLLTLFAAAIGLAVATRFNTGNVVFFYPPYRVDLSLNFFVALLILAFILLYFLIRAVRVTQGLPGRVMAYRRRKLQEESNQSLRDALKALFEGRFGQAEKAATRAAQWHINSGLSALVAARAAHRMRQTERRDVWLASTETDETLNTARLMTTLEMQVDAHQTKEALAVVDQLNASGTRHLQALQWALKAHQQANDWPEVLRLVQALDKRKALHPALSKRLTELAYEHLLSDPAHDAESLRRLWATVPNVDRLQSKIAWRAAEAFNRRGLYDDSRALLEKALAAELDVRLLRAYRDAAAATGTPALLGQIERCESWVSKRSNDPELQLTLGLFCLRQKLWGKAQRHLERALTDAAEPRTMRDAHLGLAQLFDALDQTDKAAAHYRQCALATAIR
ncbi:MAG: heme biosynthesis protein HemY [Herbaspirillum sp.]|jgi:HemY protein|nr:heme biosynthesis protein HemY [Herbaspirillum sp.]